MTEPDYLKLAHASFAGALDHVTDDSLATATACEGWSVRDLVGHLIGGELMATALLEGCSSESAIQMATSYAVVDPVPEFATASASSEAAFAESGALERTVHHPMGDLPGERLRGFRIADATLHSWDLRRALGIDESLDPALVGLLWGYFEPMAPFIGDIGMFGTGPSGTLADDADPQLRLLDLTGRRP